MSAIAGLWNRNGAPLDMSDLMRGFDRIRHRGTGEVITWQDGPIALAFRPFLPAREAATWPTRLLDPERRLAICHATNRSI